VSDGEYVEVCSSWSRELGDKDAIGKRHSNQWPIRPRQRPTYFYFVHRCVARLEAVVQVSRI